MQLNGLAYVAVGTVTDFGAEHARRVTLTTAAGKNEEYLAADGVAAACETFVRSGTFPADQGAPWARRGVRTATPNDLWRLRPVAEAIAARPRAKH